MERVTISMSDEFAEELKMFMERHDYDNRSEAIRDLARQGLRQARIDDMATGQCVASLSYVYDHHTRELAKRLTQTYHAQHDVQVATMHVHLDHEACLEIAVLKGDAARVREFADRIVSERGVTHGQLSVVPVKIDARRHSHGGSRARRTGGRVACPE